MNLHPKSLYIADTIIQWGNIMTIFNKILIATDGSEDAKRAVSAGVEIARQFDSDIYAVHVLSQISSKVLPAGSRMTEHDLPFKDIEREGNRIIGSVEEIGISEGLAVDTVLLMGHPAEEILNFADENNVDLIVVGTLGKTKIKKFLLGSVAENVVRHSDVPVLVVS